MDVRNIRHPFLIWLVGMKVPVQCVGVFVNLLPHNLVLLPAADFGQQSIFPHHTQHGFWVAAQVLFSVQPNLYAPVSVCFSAFLLAFTDHLAQRRIPVRLVHALDEAIIPAARHLEKSTHSHD
jgi:hypothetical protein